MKKILLTLAGFIVTLLSIAQSPNLMNYQGVARNAAGNVLPNKNIALRLSILNGSPTGTVVYSETRTMLTNAFGLFNVVVGSAGATNVVGTIAGVNWTAFGTGSGPKYLQVEIDPNGGASFVNVGATQLVSVPYALNAGSAAPVGPAGGDLTGNYPNPTILIPFLRTQSVPGNTMIGMTNSSTTGTLGAFQGTSASTDANAVAIQGTMSSTAPGAFSTGVKGQNNGTAGLGIGVWGQQNGSGYGVYGTTPNGWAVIGETTSGYGLWGTSGTGIGAYARSNTNTAAMFENTNAANTAPTVAVTSNSTAGAGSAAISSINTGTGRAGFFQVNNAASTANAIEASTNGTGASWGIRANSSGTNGAGLFVQSNATNTSNNVQSNQAGLGRAGLFQATNTANDADALAATTATVGNVASAVRGSAGSGGISVTAKKGVWGESSDGVGVYGTSSSLNGVMGSTNTGPAGVSGFSFGTGVGVVGSSLGGRAADFSLPATNANTVMTVTTAGTGIAANISNTNAANIAYTVRTENANTSNVATGNATERVGRGAVLANTFVYNGIPTASWGISSTGIGMMGSTSNGIGTAGLTDIGTGVQGFANSTGTAVLGQAPNAAGHALVTIGRVQIQGLGAGVNRVLTSNNVGEATWETLAASGGVSGTGIVNYIPKWTPNGTTIGNSQLFDNGTNIGLGTTSPNARLDIDNPSATTRGLQVSNTLVSNNSSAIFAQTANVASGSFFEGSAITGVMPLTVATTIASGGTTIKGIASTAAAISQFSGIGVQGASAAGFGVIGNSNSGIGVAGIGWGTGYGLYTFGRLQFEGQGAATNRIMTSIDANGNAQWRTLTSIGGVSGSGTLNFVPKWSPDGTTLGNSLVFDNGVSHSVGSTTPTTDLFYVSNPAANTWATINQAGANVGGMAFTRANAYKYDIAMNAADDFYIQNYTSGSTALTILGANANVGINQVNPTAKLDVNGTFKLSDGTQGANKVLTSDAAGNASWQVVPGSLTKTSSAWKQTFDAPSRDTTIDGTTTKVYFIDAPEITPAILATGNVTVYFRVGTLGPYELPYISNAGGRANAIQAILMPGKIAITRPTFNETAPNNINLPSTLEFRYVIIQ